MQAMLPLRLSFHLTAAVRSHRRRYRTERTDWSFEKVGTVENHL